MKATNLPVSFNLPKANNFLLQTITNCVLGGIKENDSGGSRITNSQCHLNWNGNRMFIQCSQGNPRV